MKNKEKLQKQIGEITALKKIGLPGVSFNTWKAKTNRLLEAIYGVGSLAAKDFESINYDSHEKGFIFDGMVEYMFKQGLEQAQYVLESMIDENNENEEIKVKKHKKEYVELNIRKMFDKDLVAVSQDLFENEHYSSSVFEAMKLVNNKVKEKVLATIGQEFDGTDLMNRAFSLDKPIIKLTDLKTKSNKNIQLGYMELFRGAILAVRDPKAHDHVQLKKEKAIHFLFLANLLLSRLDETCDFTEEEVGKMF